MYILLAWEINLQSYAPLGYLEVHSEGKSTSDGLSRLVAPSSSYWNERAKNWKRRNTRNRRTCKSDRKSL